VTADGYLRLDRAAAPPHALVDSFLMGHAVVISTRSGLQNGVVAQPSMHLLTRERRDELQKGISLDLVYIDVGARSEEEVKGKGIEYLDAVSFRPDLVTLANDRLAGPGLGHKAICAALAAAAEKTAAARAIPAAYFVWMAQSRFNVRGGGAPTSLGAARAQMRLRPKTVLLLEILAADRGEGTPSVGKGPVVWQPQEKLPRLKAALEKLAGERGIALQHQSGAASPLMTPFLAPENDVLILALPVKFNQTPSEVISLKDVQSLVELVASLGQKGGGL
jgi:putative aminopeptidase FrvX